MLKGALLHLRVRRAARARAGACQGLQGRARLQEAPPAAAAGAHDEGLGRDEQAGSAAQRAHGELQAPRVRLDQHALVLLQAGMITIAD